MIEGQGAVQRGGATLRRRKRHRIGWTDRTHNFTKGCSRKSAGCGTNEGGCYAEVQAYRLEHAFKMPSYAGTTRMTAHGPRWTGKINVAEAAEFNAPLSWREPLRIFGGSMTDPFHENQDFRVIAAMFAVMAATPQHTWQILTKRADRLLEFFAWVEKRERDGRAIFPDDSPSWRIGQMLAVELRKLTGGDGRRRGTRATKWEDFDPRRREWPLDNVHLGVSAENQQTADERIPLLLQLPEGIHLFVSMEPLLEDVDVRPFLRESRPLEAGEEALPDGTRRGGMEVRNGLWRRHRWLSQVIVGGESGRNSRRLGVQWVRRIRNDVMDATRRPALYIKQLGARAVIETPEGEKLYPLRAKKGEVMEEWPEDLRIQEDVGEAA